MNTEGYNCYLLPQDKIVELTNKHQSALNQRRNIILNFMARINANGIATYNSMESTDTIEYVYFNSENNFNRNHWIYTEEPGELYKAKPRKNTKEGIRLAATIQETNMKLRAIKTGEDLFYESYPNVRIRGFAYINERMVLIATKLAFFEDDEGNLVIILMIPNRTAYKRNTERGYPITNSTVRGLTLLKPEEAQGLLEDIHV